MKETDYCYSVHRVYQKSEMAVAYTGNQCSRINSGLTWSRGDKLGTS